MSDPKKYLGWNVKPGDWTMVGALFRRFSRIWGPKIDDLETAVVEADGYFEYIYIRSVTVPTVPATYDWEITSWKGDPVYATGNNPLWHSTAHKNSDGTFNLVLSPDGWTTPVREAGVDGILGWTKSGVNFSATDSDTVAWTSGTVYLPDESEYAIAAGDTGNMTAKTWIYLDRGDAGPPYTLHIGDTASDIVSFDHLILAAAQNSDQPKATYVEFGGKGDINIDANHITCNTLAAISADMGAITAGSMDAARITTGTITADRITITADRITDVAPVTADQATGGGRAYAGLTSSGNVARAIVGDDIDFGTMSPTSSGLYMTDAYLGFYGGGSPYSAANWKAFIKHDGDFYFGGDVGNYISWDGGDFKVVCTGGLIGSSTDYFNISDGIFQTKNPFSSTYVHIESGVLSVRNAADGAGDSLVNIYQSGIVIQPDIGTATQFEMLNDGLSDVFYVFINDSNDTFGIYIGADTDHQIVMSNDSSTYTIKGFTLKECIVGTDTEAVQGALRVNGNVLECYLNGGWRTAASG